ncbi:hypothetical protein ACPV3A_29535 [Paenibacillus sp. Dod16]|uniref:hypothetical protein n=1 Tax=Paenibacillus sp. Dod16 TaxID=3416392 RepID=UPI003CF6927C
MNKYIAIPNDDLYLGSHTWKKGLEYEVVERGDRLTIASDQGDTGWRLTRKDELASVFDFKGNPINLPGEETTQTDG